MGYEIDFPVEPPVTSPCFETRGDLDLIFAHARIEFPVGARTPDAFQTAGQRVILNNRGGSCCIFTHTLRIAGENSHSSCIPDTGSE